MSESLRRMKMIVVTCAQLSQLVDLGIGPSKVGTRARADDMIT
jgi:hypothetical protein